MVYCTTAEIPAQLLNHAYAVVAKAEGAELLYFSPQKICFEEKKIQGYIYENGSWQETIRPFPIVIYNAGSPQKLQKSSEIVEKLKQKIPFTSFSIGHKMKVYERPQKEGVFAKYLIPSKSIYSFSSFLISLILTARSFLNLLMDEKARI